MFLNVEKTLALCCQGSESTSRAFWGVSWWKSFVIFYESGSMKFIAQFCVNLITAFNRRKRYITLPKSWSRKLLENCRKKIDRDRKWTYVANIRDMSNFTCKIFVFPSIPKVVFMTLPSGQMPHGVCSVNALLMCFSLIDRSLLSGHTDFLRRVVRYFFTKLRHS